MLDIKNLIKQSLYATGYYHVYGLLNAPREPRLLVLCYHDLLGPRRASNPRELDNMSPTRAQFEQQLRQIKKRYRVISLRSAVEELRNSGLKEDSVAITFDDGYETFFSMAYPVLKKHDVPATVFVLTDWITTGEACWWGQVRDIVEQTDFKDVGHSRLEEVIGCSLEGIPETFQNNMSSRRRLADIVESRLRDYSPGELSKRVDDLKKILLNGHIFDAKKHRPMSWEQLREVAANGIEIESHTCSHPNIRHTQLNDIESELVSSKNEIENRLQRPVTGLAYPYGKDLEAYRKIHSLLEKHGFTFACTAGKGLNTNATDPFEIRRDHLPSTSSNAILHRDLILQFSRSSAPMKA